jgi:hypothetical protein
MTLNNGCTTLPREVAKSGFAHLLQNRFHGLTENVVNTLEIIEFFVKEMEGLLQKPEQFCSEEPAHLFRNLLTMSLQRIQQHKNYYDPLLVPLRKRVVLILGVKLLFHDMVYLTNSQKDVPNFLATLARGDCEDKAWLEAVFNFQGYDIMSGAKSEKTFSFLFEKCEQRIRQLYPDNTSMYISPLWYLKRDSRVVKEGWREWSDVIQKMAIKLGKIPDPESQLSIMFCPLTYKHPAYSKQA